MRSEETVSVRLNHKITIPGDMPIYEAFMIFYNSWRSSIVISHGKFADSHMRVWLKEICNQFAV